MSSFDESIRRLRPELFQEISRQLLERLEPKRQAAASREAELSFDAGAAVTDRATAEAEAYDGHKRYGDDGHEAEARPRESLLWESESPARAGRKASDAGAELYREEAAEPRQAEAADAGADRTAFMSRGEKAAAERTGLWTEAEAGPAAESIRRRERGKSTGETDMEKISDFFRRDARRYDGGFEQY